jgi:excisionase family DNA binding protein
MSTAIRCPSCGHALLTVDSLFPVSASQPASHPAIPLLLRISEAAELLGVSRSTLYQLVARGDLAVVKIGRSVRVPRTAVEQVALGLA